MIRLVTDHAWTNDPLREAEFAMSPDRHMAEEVKWQIRMGNAYPLQTFHRMVRRASTNARKLVWC